MSSLLPRRVSSGKLESAFSQVAGIHQMYLHADRMTEFLVIVVRPCPPPRASCTHSTRKEKDACHPLSSPQVVPTAEEVQRAGGHPGRIREHLQQQLDSVGVSQGLEPHEIPRGMVVCLEPWTMESGLVTPTGKVKRGAVAAQFMDAIWQEISRVSPQ